MLWRAKNEANNAQLLYLEERYLAKSFFVSRCSHNAGESLCQRVNENFIFIRNERNQGSLKATVTL